MSKNKWYKSKGGWIGAIILSLIGYYMNWQDCIGSSIGGAICREKFILHNLIFSPILIYLVVGFLIGYFIETKLLRKRR